MNTGFTALFASPDPGATNPAPTSSTPDALSGAADTLYVVQPNDSVRGIALAMLGSVDAASAIMAANVGVLIDEDSIIIGQTIILPGA